MIAPVVSRQGSFQEIKDIEGPSMNPAENQTTFFNNETDREPQIFTPKVPIREKVIQFLDSYFMMAFMGILAIYTLFGDDIRTSSFPKSSDKTFFAISTSCFSIFSLEFLLCCLCKKNYLFSFYFWLDLVSTLSLIPDIGWMWYPMIGVDDEDDSQNESMYKQANQQSGVAKSATKVLRVVRLIRLIRIVRLYKNASAAVEKHESDSEDEEEIIIPKESQVGKQLNDLTIKKVIIIILCLLFILPLFDTEMWITKQTSWDFGLKEIENFKDEPENVYKVINQYISFHEDDDRPIIYFILVNPQLKLFYSWSTTTEVGSLRYYEKHFSTGDFSVAVFDLRYDTQFAAELNMYQTLFICIVLTLGIIYFSKDADALVIKPIEKMVQRVYAIARNPITAGHRKHESAFDVIMKQNKRFLCFKTNEKDDKAKFEIALLEDTIIKVGVLLALGFGEAGGDIIASNMQKDKELEFVKGNKIVAVFGFCDIRNFTDSTEELQESVMIFVNEIARIVHTMVDTYHGAANKNIGDAFLLVWKFSEKDFSVIDGKIHANPESSKAKYIPDLALFSFLKILAKINKDPVILKYREHTKLNLRMPNYEVKMGFGLHIGWAIEGAIGSQFKIDASYLSPHVNMASRFEAATKQYGVPLLFSGTLYDYLSPNVQAYCRHIDTVTVKGSILPIRIYTSDSDFAELTPSKGRERTKQQSRHKRRILERKLEGGSMKSYELYELSKEIQSMKKPFTREFYGAFGAGMKGYIEGRWNDAKEKFEECLKIKPRDGPSLTLLGVMSESDFEVPNDWKGYRVLTEK